MSSVHTVCVSDEWGCVTGLSVVLCSALLHRVSLVLAREPPHTALAAKISNCTEKSTLLRLNRVTRVFTSNLSGMANKVSFLGHWPHARAGEFIHSAKSGRHDTGETPAHGRRKADGGRCHDHGMWPLSNHTCNALSEHARLLATMGLSVLVNSIGGVCVSGHVCFGRGCIGIESPVVKTLQLQQHTATLWTTSV